MTALIRAATTDHCCYAATQQLQGCWFRHRRRHVANADILIVGRIAHSAGLIVETGPPGTYRFSRADKEVTGG